MIAYLRYIVLVGAAVQVICSFSYARDVLNGVAKPNRVSWLLWSVVPLIAAFAAMTRGVGWATLPVFMSGLGPLIVFIISFANRNSYWKLGTFDYACGVLSVLALIFWAITKQPVVAIVFAIASDVLASVPSQVKTWSHPETETPATYLAGLFNALSSFAATRTFNFVSVAFPAWLAINASIFIAFIYRGRWGKLKMKS